MHSFMVLKLERRYTMSVKRRLSLILFMLVTLNQSINLSPLQKSFSEVVAEQVAIILMAEGKDIEAEEVDEILTSIASKSEMVLESPPAPPPSETQVELNPQPDSEPPPQVEAQAEPQPEAPPQTEPEPEPETEPYSAEVQFPDDCLVVLDKVIPIYIGKASQANVDKFDVVQDNASFSTEENIICFGHNTRSFSCLHDVLVGDIITLINNGVMRKYQVFLSNEGKLNLDETDIFDENGNSLVYDRFGFESTLRLITCLKKELYYDRWVVIASEIS